MKTIKIWHVIFSVVLTVLFLILGAFVFRNSYLRLSETAVDLYNSVVFSFCFLLSIRTNILPTVNSYSNVLNWQGYIPDSPDKIKAFFDVFFQQFFGKENFNIWLGETGNLLLVIFEILVIVIAILFVLFLIMRKVYRRVNNKYNKDTLALKTYKFLTGITFAPIYRFMRGYLRFIREKRWLKIIWIIIWIFNLNIASIVFGLLSYAISCIGYFDISTVFIQFSKLIIDLQVAVKTIPVIAWVILGIYLWDRARKKIAINRLRHFEARNCGFIKELPIVSLACGSMGKKKTTLITDMTLSQAIMFRQEALKRLQKADMKFPYFPWVCLEQELLCRMEEGSIYNLATVRNWISGKKEDFEQGNELLYDYNVKRYGLTYDDGLKEETLFDTLLTYAQLFFIYVISSSLILSNYAIREDGFIVSEGNFPMWVFNFFKRNNRQSRHSHILDFDILRLGKKVLKENENTVFEFGVVTITEIGKERGNNLELKEVKKESKQTNQKNDMFNAWLKMCRHSATVDNFPFIKVFCDEQRPESWGADARDLADVITIEKSGEQKLSLPFYTIEEMVAEWIYDKFLSIYYDLRFYRGDNTLLIYLLKKIASAVFKRNERIYNRYGYSILTLSKERGTMDGKKEKKKYFLSNMKIYSDRFSTDCFSDYFNELGRKVKKGLQDYMEYKESKASVEELKMQNSYFINSLYKENDGESSA